MIVVSDGDPSPPFASTLNLYKQAGIQITTVAVGTHGPAGSTPLQDIAAVTGGQYYVVTDPKCCPRSISANAARVPAGGEGLGERRARHRVSARDPGGDRRTAASAQGHGADDRQRESAGGSGHPVARSRAIPRTRRFSPPGHTASVAPRWSRRTPDIAGPPPGPSGRTTTSSTASLVRWAMRPSSDRGKYTVATDVRDGKVRVVITALDANDEFRNSLAMTGAAIGPDLQPFDFQIRQLAPGPVRGRIRREQGRQLPPDGRSRRRRCADLDRRKRALFGRVPRSRHEHRAAAAIGRLATGRRSSGRAVRTDLDAPQMDQLLALNTFRPDLPKAVSIRDVWPLLLLVCGLVFLADVFVRRVAVTLDWVVPALGGCGARCRSPRGGGSGTAFGATAEQEAGSGRQDRSASGGHAILARRADNMSVPACTGEVDHSWQIPGRRPLRS